MFLQHKFDIDLVSKKLKKSMKNDKRQPYHAYLTQLITSEDNINTSAVCVAQDEFICDKLGRPTIFIDSELLPQQLFDIPIKGNEESVLSDFKNRIIQIAFKNGTKVNGVNVYGFLFGILDSSYVINIYQEMMKVAQLNINVTNRVSGINSVIDLSYNFKKGVSYQLRSPSKDISQLINAPEMFRLENERLKFLSLTESALDEDEMQYQVILCKIAFGLAAYMKAFPHKIITGFPVKNPKILDHKIALHKGRHLTIKGFTEETFGTKSPHWRSSHFRVLRHERFKRDEFGNPRIVFVKDSIIGESKIEASYVTE